jgi:hypothetical protein
LWRSVDRWTFAGQQCRDAGARGEAELGERVGDVLFDRALAEVQTSGDLSVRVPRADQAGDLALACGQRRQPVVDVVLGRGRGR